MLTDNQVVQIQQINANVLLNRIDEIIESKIKKFSQVSTETSEGNDKYITTKEVAEIYGVSEVSVWDWEKKGFIVGYRIGQTKRYKLSEIMNAPKLIIRKKK